MIVVSFGMAINQRTVSMLGLCCDADQFEYSHKATGTVVTVMSAMIIGSLHV